MKEGKKRKYCFYYKGEKENPYDHRTLKYGPVDFDSDISRWWWYESMYFRSDRSLPGNHKEWEDLAVKAMHEIPAVEFLMCAPDVPIETKGFLAWSIATTLCHVAHENFDFFEEYGRGFLPDYLYTGEAIDHLMTEEERYKLCRYYKGGDQNPFEVNDQRYTFWGIEETWFKLVANDFSRRAKYVVPFVLAFDRGLPGFPIDESLKATMYEYYLHFGGSKDSFGDFLISYLCLAPK